MDWEELSRKITIYEFFKPEDKKIHWPEIQNIKSYQNIPSLLQLMKSEDLMRRKLNNKLQALVDQLGKNQAQETAVAGGMIKMMQKKGPGSVNPIIVDIAANVIKAIANAQMKKIGYYNNWLEIHGAETKAAVDKVKEGSIQRDGESGNDMCNRIGNKLVSQAMADINPVTLFYLKEFEEDQRNITNALLTWTSILNNASAMPSDLSMQALISIAQLYLTHTPFGVNGSSSFYVQSCDINKDLPDLAYEEPLLPNFDCPIVYSIPSGFSQMGNMGSASKNDFNIPQNKSSQFTQSSTSYSTSGQGISEAGKSPYHTTDNSSSDVSFGTGDDDEVVPLAPLHNNSNSGDDDEDIVPLPPSPKSVTGSDDDEVVPLSPTKEQRDAKAAADRKATKELLDEYSEQFCKDELGQKADRMKKLRERMKKLSEQLEKEEQEDIKKAEVKQKSMNDDDEEPVPLAPTKKVEDVKKHYSEVKAAVQEASNNGGLTPSISNGLTMAGKAIGDLIR
jgi:hypothetical protein